MPINRCELKPRAKLFVITPLIALTLAGCAKIPDLGALATPKTEEAFAAEQTFGAAQGHWPKDQWWQGYNDPQLNQLMEEALSQSPDLQAAEARLRRSAALARVVDASSAPQLSGSASLSSQRLSYNYLTPKATTPQGWNDQGRATVDLFWDPDFWGRNRALSASAQARFQATQAEHAQARLSLTAAIAAQYAELARLWIELDTAQRSVEIRTKTLSLFKQRYNNGLETLSTVSNAEAALASAETAQLQLEEQRAIQTTRIAALLGTGPDRALQIQRPTIQLSDTRGLPKSLHLELLGRRPDIVAARWRVEAEAQGINEKRAAFYPNINLSAFIGVQALGIDLLNRSDSTMGGVGPTLSLPIFTAGRLEGQLNAQAATYDEAVANYHRAISLALQEVAATGLSIRALSDQLFKAQAAEQAAQNAYRIVRNRYEGGVANYIEVFFAQEALLDAQRALARLQSRAFSLDVALQHALGGGYQTTPSTQSPAEPF